MKAKQNMTSESLSHIFFFSLSPIPPSLYQKPRYPVCAAGNFFDRNVTMLKRYIAGGEATFSIYSVKVKQSKWCSLKLLQSNLTGHYQRIAPLHNDEHFAPSLCVFKKNMVVTTVNCEIPSSWLVLIYSNEPKMWTGHRWENLIIIFWVLVFRQGKKKIKFVGMPQTWRRVDHYSVHYQVTDCTRVGCHPVARWMTLLARSYFWAVWKSRTSFK